VREEQTLRIVCRIRQETATPQAYRAPWTPRMPASTKEGAGLERTRFGQALAIRGAGRRVRRKPSAVARR
jgi:hypothetical protein